MTDRPPFRLPAVSLLLVAATVAGCASAAPARPGSSVPVAATDRGSQAATGPVVRATPLPSQVARAPASAAPAPVTRPIVPVGPSSPKPAAATPVPQPHEAFALSLYRRGDYVGQYTLEWCVGASLQMALNIVGPRNDATRVRQQVLWEMARDRSFSPFGGANPRGWTAALNDLGVGPYQLVSLPTFDEAVRMAASAIQSTRRPVGLVMWRGRHAWVMSGFESLGDPRRVDDFEVTGIRVLDPLYPHGGSSTWGPSPKPNSLITPEILAKQFVYRDRRRVDLGVAPGYLLVLPVGA
jgi:hypothetical protein